MEMKKKKKKRDEGQTKNEHIMASTAEEKETTEPREWGVCIHYTYTPLRMAGPTRIVHYNGLRIGNRLFYIFLMVYVLTRTLA